MIICAANFWIMAEIQLNSLYHRKLLWWGMKKTIVDNSERRGTLMRRLVFVCCDGDVDVSLNICGKMDVLWKRTRVTVGSWWTRENKKGKETACNSLSAWITVTILENGWAIPTHILKSLLCVCIKICWLFSKNFPQLREQSERLYPKMNRCFTSYPFSEGPTSTTGRIDGTTS